MDNNQSSQSSDSEFSKKNKTIKKYQYPNPPSKSSISFQGKYETVKVVTNLLNLMTKDNINLILANLVINPCDQALNKDLKKRIKNDLLNNNNFIKKILFYQNYIFAIINSNFDFPSTININSTNEKNTPISINFENIKKFQYKNFISYDNNNPRNIGNIAEIIIKEILLKNQNVVKFGKKSLLEFDINFTKNKFWSFYISSQITCNGLYMLINYKEKIISKSVYMKINEIKNLYKEKAQQREKINEYFEMHKNVIPIYGLRKVYTISKINFDKSPLNTIINITKFIN